MFAPYTDNQVEARCILSTSFMEKLKKYKKNNKNAHNIKIAFKDNIICVAMASIKDFLEVDLKSVIDSKEGINLYYNEIKELTSIVEELNSNLKTYKKEKQYLVLTTNRN